MNKIRADVRKRVQPATGAARSISWQLSPCMQMTGFADCKAVSLCKGGEQQLKAKQDSVSQEKQLFTPRRARPGSGEQEPAAAAEKLSS